MDMKTILETYGIYATLAVCVVAVMSWITIKRIKKFIKDQLSLIACVEKSQKDYHDLVSKHEKIFEDIKEIVKRFDYVFMQHVEDTERIASEEHWKFCQMDKCPYLQKYFEELRDQTQLINHFHENIKSSYKSMKESNSIMMRRLDDFSAAVMTWYRRNGNT